ncbi:MAG: hypothetical protein ACM3JI_04285, partial [Anaerolineae bacterium]
RLSDLQDITGSAKEEKFLKAVGKSFEEEEAVESLEPTTKKRRILDVVKGFLPKKKERVKKEEGQPSQVSAKARPAIKTVTQIQSKKGKKK